MKLSKPIAIGDKWMRGVVIAINYYHKIGGRYWIVTVEYKTVPNKNFTCYID